MACSLTLTGRSRPCRNALGGVKKVWMATSVHTGDGFWDAIDSAGECPDTAAASTFNDFLSPKNTSSFTQTVNASIENGTVFYSQQLTLVLNNMAPADIAILENLGKGRVAIVVQDNNDNYFVMGHTNGCFLTGGTAATGTAMGDLNGYSLEFTAEEVDAAPLMPYNSTTGLPDTTNASFS
jgi:hypothetical protein